MKFRKKPIVVEAYEFTQKMVEAHLFDGAKLPEGLRMTRASYHREDRKIFYAYFEVQTINGERVSVEVGNYVIAESDGKHFYPCVAEVFDATYEAVR